MPIANDMKNIAEGIEVSYGERMSWLADATKDTHQMMNRIGRENKEAAEDTHQMMNRIHGENKEAAEAVSRLLFEFRREQEELATKLAEFLSLSEKQRIEDFHLMDEEIKKSVADVRNETKEIMERVRREIDEIGPEVASLLSRFRKEHGEMSAELSRKLTEEEAKRLEEFKPWFADIQNRLRELLTATREDLKEAHTHWQNLAKIMASKRTGKRVPIAEVPKETEVPKRVEEAAEEAFTEGELKMKALSLIGENSNGISLVQLGRELRVAYVRLGRSIRELQDEGKVVKRDSLYFPT